jgi:hypothetical protein
MTKQNALEAVGYNDHATCGPVRARSHEILDATRWLATIACALNLMISFVAAAPPKKAPDPAVVTRAVQAYFASRPDYQPGDLITRSQIERLLTKLDEAGATVPDSDKVAERGLDDGSFIARELTTASGKRFMRRLARNPSTFAHLDRLSSIPRGEKLIRDLMHDKDGDKLIEYLATTKGGQKMGSMMSAVPGGRDLNKQTDRIYTVADLVTAINAAYATTSH